MSGKFIAYVLSVFTFFYLLLISISFLLFMGIRERVNDICYDIAENISTKGRRVFGNFFISGKQSRRIWRI